MAKGKRFNRPFKVLSAIFVILAMVGFDVMMTTRLAQSIVDGSLLIIFYGGVMGAAAALAAATLVILLASGFGKYSTKEIINSLPKLLIVTLSSTVISALILTVTFVMAICQANGIQF